MCILFKNKLIKPTTGMCDNIIQLQNEYCISEKKKKGLFFFIIFLSYISVEN